LKVIERHAQIHGPHPSVFAQRIKRLEINGETVVMSHKGLAEEGLMKNRGDHLFCSSRLETAICSGSRQFIPERGSVSFSIMGLIAVNIQDIELGMHGCFKQI
jgi:hypothetical protein